MIYGADFQKTLEVAIVKANDTEKDWEEYRQFFEGWEKNSGHRMRNILELSSESSLRTYRDSFKSGHSVQLLEHEIIAEEVKHVYDCELKCTAQLNRG